MEKVSFKIESLTSSVPANVVSNESFANLFNDKSRKLFERTTGICERRYASSNTTASDLGYDAAHRLLDSLHDRESIESLIWVSQTSDYKIPFTSNILANKLGLSKSTFCLDINAGCAGFIQALYTAAKISQGRDGKVLLVVAETLSKILSRDDRGTAPLFGDGASALIISSGSGLEDELSFFSFAQDGGEFEAIIIPDGGYRNMVNLESFIFKMDEIGNKKNNLHLSMNGSKVFDFTLREIPKFVNSFIKFCNFEHGEIDYFVFHQSNKMIINQICLSLGIPLTKTLVNIQKYGNTSGVSIPLVLNDFYSIFTTGPKRVCLTGYGSGLTWGSCLLTLGPSIEFLPIKDL